MALLNPERGFPHADDSKQRNFMVYKEKSRSAAVFLTGLFDRYSWYRFLFGRICNSDLSLLGCAPDNDRALITHVGIKLAC